MMVSFTVELQKGMYGLKQAAVLAHDVLSNLLQSGDYIKIPGSLGMWKHKTRCTIFCLCVDNFGVKYYTKDDVHHLQKTLQPVYDVKIDWTGENFLGYKLRWNYLKNYVDISMPTYIPNLLKKLNYKPHKNPQYSPHEYVPINWTSHTNRQYAMEEDTSAFLSIPDTKYVQSAIGSLLYYGRALDGSILPTLSQIASKQATPTIKTKHQIQHLLDYINTYPTAYLRFHASDMELTVTLTQHT